MRKVLLRLGIDFIYDNHGRMILLRRYHIRRGYCCGNACMHCPYDGVKGSKQLK